MINYKKLFFLIPFIFSFSTHAQNTPEHINQLKIQSYNECVKTIPEKEEDIKKINSMIISCMEKKGFSTSPPKEKLISDDERIKNRVQFTTECSKKFAGNEQGLINCLNSRNEF